MQTESKNNPRTPAQYARLFFTGVAMGAADIVPGVSGGTMAFILGVYEDLLNAIKSFNLDLIRTLLKGNIKGAFEIVPWRFLIALGLGIVAAILTLVSALEFALHTYPIFLFSFFTGLILASIIAVATNVRWGISTVISLLVGTVFAYIVVGLRPQEVPHTPIVLFLSGAVAICAMILPGISGSFLLLVLGQYEHVISAVKNFDIVTVGLVAAGCAVGIIGFSRVLSWLLKHYEQITIAALVGFMVGSLRVIYPFKAPIEPLTTYVDTEGFEVAITRNVLPWLAQHTENLDTMVRLTNNEVAIAIGLMVLGFLLVSLLDHLQSGANPVFRPFFGAKQVQPAPTGD